MFSFLHLGCRVNLRQDSWGACIPKRLLEKAVVTERKGGSGNQGVLHARRRAVGLLGSFPPVLTITRRESGDSSEPNGPFSIFISQLGAECSFLLSLIFFNSGKKDGFPAML